MANARQTDTFYEYARVDTDPGADGYATTAIIPRQKNQNSQNDFVWFSCNFITGTTMVVTLQFKLPATGAAWQDYDSYDGSDTKVRKKIEDGAAGVQWRGIVKQADFSAGDDVIFGFDW